jgi:hypothetical protein
MRNFDPINLRVWIAETFDCDDFAQVLEGKVNGFFPGIALGTLWYGDKAGTWGHAIVAVGYEDNVKIKNLKCNKETTGALLTRNSW